MQTLLDRVHTSKGDIIVITKDRFLFFFNRSRTSIMPYKISDFGTKIGFQVRYNTSDVNILQELHELYSLLIAAGGFESLMIGAKMGVVDFPDEKKHLTRYVVGYK